MLIILIPMKCFAEMAALSRGPVKTSTPWTGRRSVVPTTICSVCKIRKPELPHKSSRYRTGGVLCCVVFIPQQTIRLVKTFYPKTTATATTVVAPKIKLEFIYFISCASVRQFALNAFWLSAEHKQTHTHTATRPEHKSTGETVCWLRQFQAQQHTHRPCIK